MFSFFLAFGIYYSNIYCQGVCDYEPGIFRCYGNNSQLQCQIEIKSGYQLDHISWNKTSLVYELSRNNSQIEHICDPTYELFIPLLYSLSVPILGLVIWSPRYYRFFEMMGLCLLFLIYGYIYQFYSTCQYQTYF